mgnify:CR=1 FL=1
MVCVAMLRKKETTVIAVKSRFLGRPSPDWNEEELENVVIANFISGRRTTKTSTYVPLQYLRYLLPQSSEKEEEHSQRREGNRRNARVTVTQRSRRHPQQNPSMVPGNNSLNG